MATIDYTLNTVVPSPGTPIGYAAFGDQRVPIHVSEEWRNGWFERVGTRLFGPTGEEDFLASIPAGSYLAAVTGDTTNGLTVGGTPGAGWTATLTLAQNIKTTASPQFAGLNISGNIVLSGVIDGRDPSVDGTKLDGIASGATANATDAQLRDRSTHTGTQNWSTLTGTPTTISGYGITDAYTKTEVDTAVGGKVTKDASITAASESHAVTDFATTNSALDALGAIINEMRTAFNT